MDLTSNSVKTTTSVGKGPIFLALNPQESRLYVANTLSGSVSISKLGTDGMETSGYTNVFAHTPAGIAVSPDGNIVFVANNGGSEIWLLDENGKFVVVHFSGAGRRFLLG